MSRLTISHIEKQNHMMRMHCRRLTRLTNAFSKKIENFEPHGLGDGSVESSCRATQPQALLALDSRGAGRGDHRTPNRTDGRSGNSFDLRSRALFEMGGG